MTQSVLTQLLQLSNQTYSQGMCMQYEREGRTVRNMLLRGRGSPSSAMLDNLNREPIISIAQLEVPTDVTLKWYQSQTVKGSALVNPRYFAKQTQVAMVSFLSLCDISGSDDVFADRFRRHHHIHRASQTHVHTRMFTVIFA